MEKINQDIQDMENSMASSKKGLRNAESVDSFHSSSMSSLSSIDKTEANMLFSSDRDGRSPNLNEENENEVVVKRYNPEDDCPINAWCFSIGDRIIAFKKGIYYKSIYFIVYTILMFGDLIQYAFFAKSADEVFSYIFFITLLMFLADILLTCVVDPKYLGGYFFWLDLSSMLINIVIEYQK
jgi:hypothetical protein